MLFVLWVWTIVCRGKAEEDSAQTPVVLLCWWSARKKGKSQSWSSVIGWFKSPLSSCNSAGLHSGSVSFYLFNGSQDHLLKTLHENGGECYWSKVIMAADGYLLTPGHNGGRFFGSIGGIFGMVYANKGRLEILLNTSDSYLAVKYWWDWLICSAVTTFF